MKILMVCLGNICRSPLAEGILQEMALKAGLNWQVESAGTSGNQTGEPPHEFSIKVAGHNGIDISGQKSRSFTAADLEAYDRIYAMSMDVLDDMKRIARRQFNPKKVSLFLNEQYPGEDRDVPDPWYGAEDGYHQAYKIINDNCEAIIKRELSLADPEKKDQKY